MLCFYRFTYEYKFTKDQQNILYKKVGSVDELQQLDDHFNEEIRYKRSSGSLTKAMGSWMGNIQKFSVSAVTKMKTYIKKKEIEEEPVPDLNEDTLIDNEEMAHMDSTDASKTNSESSPPKDLLSNVHKEIEIDQIQKPLEEGSPEKEEQNEGNEANQENEENGDAQEVDLLGLDKPVLESQVSEADTQA